MTYDEAYNGLIKNIKSCSYKKLHYNEKKLRYEAKTCLHKPEQCLYKRFSIVENLLEKKSSRRLAKISF